MIFYFSAANLAKAKRKAVDQHGAPALLCGFGLDFFAPQPCLCACIVQRELFAVAALCAVHHKQMMCRFKAAFFDGSGANAAAHDMQLFHFGRAVYRQHHSLACKACRAVLQQGEIFFCKFRPFRHRLRQLLPGFLEKLEGKSGTLQMENYEEGKGKFTFKPDA